MEPLFTVHSELSSDDRSDIIKLFVKETLPLYLICIAVSIAYGVYCFRGNVTLKGYPAVFAVLWLTVFSIFRYIIYGNSLKRRMSAYIEKAGKLAEYEFFDEHITVKDETGSRSIMNNEISAITETDRVFYIFPDKNEYLVVFKSLTPKELHEHIRKIKTEVRAAQAKADRKTAIRGLLPLILVLCLIVAAVLIFKHLLGL